MVVVVEICNCMIPLSPRIENSIYFFLDLILIFYYYHICKLCHILQGLVTVSLQHYFEDARTYPPPPKKKVCLYTVSYLQDFFRVDKKPYKVNRDVRSTHFMRKSSRLAYC